MHSLSLYDNVQIGRHYQNNVSKTSVVKNKTVTNYLKLSDTKTCNDKNDIISEKLIH